MQVFKYRAACTWIVIVLQQMGCWTWCSDLPWKDGEVPPCLPSLCKCNGLCSESILNEVWMLKVPDSVAAILSWALGLPVIWTAEGAWGDAGQLHYAFSDGA